MATTSFTTCTDDGSPSRPSNAAYLILDFEPTHAAASDARRQARSTLDQAGVPIATAADLELIIAELCSNAVDQEPDQPIHLALTIASTIVLLTVSNRIGLRTEPIANEVPDQHTTRLSERGRGLSIVTALADCFEIERAAGWTSVHCFRRIAARPRAG